MSKGRSYYDILGVSPDAESAVIEAAYRALIKKYHPDRRSGGADRSAELNDAFSILRDPRKRMEYDRERGIGSAPPSRHVQDRDQVRGSAGATAAGRATKECPDCGETVRKNARVCRFCGYEFWSDDDSLEPVPETEPARGMPLWKPLAAIAGVLFLVWLLGLCSYTPQTPSEGNASQGASAAPPDMNATDENALIDDTSTTDQSVGAQSTAYDQAESNLTAAYRALMTQLPSKERLDLRTDERAWIANRNRVCGFETRGVCATTWTTSRAQELDRQWVERFMPHVGQCFSTTVAHVGPRLEGDTDNSAGGASVAYQDGHYQVDYESSPTTLGFNVGDAVRLCVVSLPRECPPGDHRGIDYEATDLVTGRTFKAADSEHECGGA